jgi:hypothetical protein
MHVVIIPRHNTLNDYVEVIEGEIFRYQNAPPYKRTYAVESDLDLIYGNTLWSLHLAFPLVTDLSTIKENNGW